MKTTLLLERRFFSLLMLLGMEQEVIEANGKSGRIPRQN